MTDYEVTQRLTRLGIPREYREKTLDNFRAETDEQRRQLEWATETLENIHNPKNAILWGNPGTGKTHLACAVTSAAAEKVGAWWVEWTATWKERVQYIKMPTLIGKVRDTFSKGSDTTQQKILDRLVELHLLVLDEVGVQKGSDFEHDFMDNLVDGRNSEGRSTILISNLQKVELQVFLGARIVSRLRDRGCSILPFTGEDQRGRDRG